MAALPPKLLNAKKAFILACLEQLVPVLPEATIQGQVYPMCYPSVGSYMRRMTSALIIAFRHLWDPSDRETYESAHSVMLAISASHAQNASSETAPPGTSANPAFAEKLVPMYARCLVEVRRVESAGQREKLIQFHDAEFI